MTKIGPTFLQELIAAGLGPPVPCSWSSDGTYNISGLTSTQQTSFQQVLAAHDPTEKSISISYLDFRALFTETENSAIMMAALQNHVILDWVLQAAGAGQIYLSDPRTKAGLDALVAAKILTADRETAILANQPPTP